MINSSFRTYPYYQYQGKDAYAQPQLSAEPIGTVKMAIFITSQTIQENINYSGANYVGFTYNKEIDDDCVIQYGSEKLKVLYVNPLGRKIQVFLARV